MMASSSPWGISPGTCYIAGPMRKYPWYNFDAFDRAAGTMRQLKWRALNPADLDRKAGFDPHTCGIKGAAEGAIPIALLPKHSSLREIVRRDVLAVLRSNILILLPGWRKSVGVKAEVAVARFAMIQCFELRYLKNGQARFRQV